MKCFNCSAEKAGKVIAFGLPMYFCDECKNLWGFWSYLYAYVLSPIEGFFNYEFSFMFYEGSYFQALFFWLFKR